MRKIPTITPLVVNDQEFKNYKEMCTYLELPILRGNSKKSQMKWLSQFFTVEKDGQKLKVTEVIKPLYSLDDFKQDKDILDKYIQTLLLRLFIEHEDNQMYISRSELWEKLGMVNKDYATSEYEKINKEHYYYKGYYFKEWIFNYFKSRVNQTLTNKLKQTLNHLQNRRLIEWRKVYIEINKRGHFVVDSPSKQQFILCCERKAIDDVIGKTVIQNTNNGKMVERQSNMSDVYSHGKFKEYEKQLNKYLAKRNIQGVYKKYHIILNDKDLLTEALKIDYGVLCRKVNERTVSIINKGAGSADIKYPDSKANIGEIQRWLTQRLIYLGWHTEHFFDKPLEEEETTAVTELEKDIPWKQTA